jgi:CRISPR-associated endonuclease Csn1
MLTLNNGKNHQPILKVRTFEPKGNKFNIGTSGSKSSKYVEAEKGTNLFFAIYANEEGKRNFETIPLNIVVERLKQGLTEVPETNEKGDKLLFYLSPNDLVYVPNKEHAELENFKTINISDANASKYIYKMISCSGSECHFVQHHTSSLIKQYGPKSKIGEFGSLNKMEVDVYGVRIKEVCIKLKIDRLGII